MRSFKTAGIASSVVLAITLALALGTGPRATASKSVTYRYAVHHAMKKATDARPAAQWLINQGFDIAGMNLGKQEIEVITDDAGLELLNKNGYRGRVIQKFLDGEFLMPDKRYLNPATNAAKLAELNKLYPTLTRIEQVGTSLQNRPILAMLVSTTPGKDDAAALAKPSIMVDGMHHAREIMTPEIVMDIAEHLLQSYTAGDAEAKKLLEGWNVWVLPMLNVDGNNVVWTSDNMWRKNARSTRRGRMYGVDINRNYPYRWNDCGGSSGSTSAQDYRGKSAASEPETLALMNLAEMAHPTASLSYHSYSELVLYPYGCDGALTGDNDLEKRVGDELAAMLPSDSGRGNYDPGAPWQILYAVDGDSMDYVFSQFGALSYTFEVNQEFQPDYDLRQPTLEKHRKAWKYFLNRSMDNLFTLKVVDAKTGKPLAAQLGVNTIPHTQNEQPFSTNTGGQYFKVLDPGTYILTVKAADGRTADVTVTMNGKPQQQTVQLK